MPDESSLAQQSTCQEESPLLLSQEHASDVDLLRLTLFQYFKTCTRHTLAFDTVWEKAIKLSVGCESLMHAILCLSAKHLAYLHTDNAEYEMVAAIHLSKTLHLYQKDLNETITVSNVDCHLTTATLLSYIVWNEVDIVPAGTDSLVTVNALEDRVFSIAGGTLEIFMSANFWIFRQQSIFLPHIMYNPRVALCYAIGLNSSIIDRYQRFFDYNCSMGIDRLSIPNFFDCPRTDDFTEDISSYFNLPDEATDTVEAYRRVVPRLCVILAFLPEMQRSDDERSVADCLPDLARYIFSFPISCFRESGALARRENPKWWLILYHFYRAARIILPDHFWWAQRRSKFMELLLKDLLLRECRGHQD